MTDRSGKFAGDDPFLLARSWLEEATKSEPEDANAMALATVDKTGLPNVRMVLLKEIEADAFVFYTNFDSAKGGELATNPNAAFVMHWKSLRRQIRVRGTVSRVEGAQADAYFQSRDLQSRLGAWASDQSQPLASKATLLARVAKATATHKANPPRPDFWGGYRIVPLEIEFWAAGNFRLHDRYHWSRDKYEDEWKITRLFP